MFQNRLVKLFIIKKLLLSITLVLGASFVSNAQVQGYSVGSTVNDFTVTDVHGNTHQLSAITGSGQWVVIDFFFTTCRPCQATAPIFSELHQKYGCNTGDLFCISIDTGDDDAEVLAFENTYATSSGHAPSPAVSGVDGNGQAVISDFNPAAYPTYCLIDPDMTIRNLDIWPVSSVADLEAAFASAGFSPTEQACPLLIEDVELSLNDVKLFPNPAVNSATLSVELDASTDVNVKIYNMVRAEVSISNYAGTEGTNEFALDTEAIANGQYVVSVSIGDVATRKLNFNIVK